MQGAPARPLLTLPTRTGPGEQLSSLDDLHHIKTIGVGNFGNVHVVSNTQTGTKYAMKVMSKEGVIKRNQLKHTLDELKVLKDVRNHPYIIQFQASFMDSQNLYICLELGFAELFTVLRQVRRFEFKTAQLYSAEILSCLEYLHSKDYVYRDLKPENVLFAEDGHLRLCDFGFAKHVPDRTWTLCGTPEYMAPEIILGKGHDKAVDYWSLGIFIFELLAGYPPFFGPDSISVYENVLDGVYYFPDSFNAASKSLITALLNRTRSKRLGNLVGGIRDIKIHEFFAELSWDDLLAGKIPAPPIPSKKSGPADRFEDVQEVKYCPRYDKEDKYLPFFLGWDSNAQTQAKEENM